jgi:hypothetical protein
MAVTLNASTSTGYIQTADTSGDLALQSNGTTQFTVSSTGAYGQLKAATAVTASGTSVDFTSIPSWVRRITVMFSGVSTNGTSNRLVQIGSGSFVSTGYTSNAILTGSNSLLGGGSSSGFIMASASTSDTVGGSMVLTNISGNVWVSSHAANLGTANSSFGGGYSSALSGTLDRVRITTVNGTDTFDAGTINILYEG